MSLQKVEDFRGLIRRGIVFFQMRASFVSIV